MRPDLFEGAVLQDDSHRILARLANGGSMPAPPRRWAVPWNAAQRARMAAVAALLAIGAAAWVWLQDGGQREPAAAGRPAAVAAAQAARAAARDGMAAPENASPGAAAQLQAAPIVNSPASPQTRQPRKGAEPGLAPGRPAPLAAAGPAPVHPRADRTAPKPRGQRNAPATAESDQDVTLLAAMLKHANPQKAPASVPKD
jgi:hypothetical protein